MRLLNKTNVLVCTVKSGVRVNTHRLFLVHFYYYSTKVQSLKNVDGAKSSGFRIDTRGNIVCALNAYVGMRVSKKNERFGGHNFVL